MFKKAKLKGQIKSYQKQIQAVESKRYRSQASLVEAILTSSSPDDSDVDFFNKYTEEIDSLRAKMKELQVELDELG